MRFRLVPSDDGFFDLFSQSAENAADCARLLEQVVGATKAASAEAHARVLECERRGDTLTDAILHRLDSTFVTPFDREDIHALAEELDDVVDDMFAVSDLLQLVKPKKKLKEVGELATILVQMADEMTALMRELEGLKGTKPMLERIDQLESEGDAIYRRTMARLFGGEFEALEVLKWKDVVQAMEDSLNTIEDVSDIVASIVFKHA